jgi:hypothetical protein
MLGSTALNAMSPMEMTQMRSVLILEIDGLLVLSTWALQFDDMLLTVGRRSSYVPQERTLLQVGNSQIH